MELTSLTSILDILKPVTWQIRCGKNITLLRLISKEHLLPTLIILKASSLFRFSVLSHLTVVDYIDDLEYDYVEYENYGAKRKSDMYVYYVLRSLSYNQVMILEVPVDDNKKPSPMTFSVASVYPAAVWFEREMYDMFGVYFIGHPDLRRILTDYGFKHHPLKKEYPLTGFKEIRYDDRTHSLLSEKIEFAQLRKTKHY